jgi:hypothetical protein
MSISLASRLRIRQRANDDLCLRAFGSLLMPIAHIDIMKVT